MTNYRSPKYVERYEDVVFELDTALVVPANGAHQTKTNHRIVVDNSGEIAPFDWYHARFNVDFKLQLLANGGNVDANNQIGIVNSAFSLINNLNVSMNGVSVYDCPEVNHAINIKNLLEYSQGYANSQGANEFFYIDKTRETIVTEFTQIALDGNAQNIRPSRTADYNSGFAARKALLVNNAVANAEIPLNRYGFFEKLHNELLPNTKIELKITFESDTNLIWRTAGNNCRIVITKFQLSTSHNIQRIWIETLLR